MSLEKPNYDSYEDKNLFEELRGKKPSDWTDKEYNFMKYMYLAEKYECGLG